jgi:hypothetical protein
MVNIFVRMDSDPFVTVLSSFGVDSMRSDDLGLGLMGSLIEGKKKGPETSIDIPGPVSGVTNLGRAVASGHPPDRPLGSSLRPA